MPNTRKYILTTLACGFLLVVSAAAEAALIVHYKFDVDSGGSTPDAVGANSASLGSAVSINTTGGIPKTGAGALEMVNLNNDGVGNDGAVTSNSFSWTTDTRTLTFWWRAKTPNVDAAAAAYVSMGTTPTAGERFDVMEIGSTTDLRVEIQGGGESTTGAMDDGTWHFVAVTVPDPATIQDIGIFLDGGSDLNTSTNTGPVNTGTGPITFGNSIFGGIVLPTATSTTCNSTMRNSTRPTFRSCLTILASYLESAAVPEPSTFALLGIGAIGLIGHRRRKRKKTA